MFHTRRCALSLTIACLLVLGLLAKSVPVQASGPIGLYFKGSLTVSSCGSTSMRVPGIMYSNVPSDGKQYSAIRSIRITDGTNSGFYNGPHFLLPPTPGEIEHTHFVGLFVPTTSPGP